MRTADRFIRRLYAANTAILALVLLTFVVAVDVLLNLRRYTSVGSDIADAAGDGGGTIIYTTLVIADLWGPRLLQLFNYLAGLILIAAMGFTCAQLVRHRELVALLAAGVSLRRAALPFFVVAAVVIALQALSQEVAVPRVAHLLVRDANDIFEQDAQRFQLPLTPDGEGWIIMARRFNADRQTLEGLAAWRRDAAGEIVARLTAARAIWEDGRWLLENGAYIDLTTAPPTQATAASFTTSLDPRRIMVRHLEGFGGNLSWSQIDRLVQSPDVDARQRAMLERARWGRMAMLATNLLTLAAALPFFLLRLPQPLLGAALRALPIAGIGLAASLMAPALALPGVPPVISACIPAAMLAPIAAALFWGMKT